MKKYLYVLFFALIGFMVLIPTITVNAKSSGDSVYDSFKEKNEKEYQSLFNKEKSADSGGWDNLSDILWREFFEIHSFLVSIFPLGLIGSIVLGIIILLCSRKNKVLFKVGLYTFIIGIPFILILLVFVTPQLYTYFT